MILTGMNSFATTQGTEAQEVVESIPSNGSHRGPRRTSHGRHGFSKQTDQKGQKLRKQAVMAKWLSQQASENINIDFTDPLPGSGSATIVHPVPAVPISKGASSERPKTTMMRGLRASRYFKTSLLLHALANNFIMLTFRTDTP